MSDQLSDQPTKRKRGNPNFTEGNRFGVALPAPLEEGEKTERVSTRLPAGLKEKFDALPGSASEKLRNAVELLIQQSEHQAE
jgi:hypothetical protein